MHHHSQREEQESYHTIGYSPTVPVLESTVYKYLLGPRSIHQYDDDIFHVRQSGGKKKQRG